MSERQAKLKRKNEVSEVKKTKKRTKGEIITNVIIVAAVVAVLGLGGWAIASKYMVNDTQNNQQNEQTTDDASQQQTVPTVGEYAETLGMSAEDFMKEYGLEGNDAVTVDTDMETASQQMTFANYAKMSGTDTAGMRESMGLDNSVTDDMPMSEVYQIMAEKMGNTGEETSGEQTEGNE